MKQTKEIKRTKKGAGKTVTLVGVYIDNDILPHLKAKGNVSRYINDVLRSKIFG